MKYAALFGLLLSAVFGLIFVGEFNTLIGEISTIPSSVETIVYFIPFGLIIVSIVGLILLVSGAMYYFISKGF
tara:strand:+ start:77 stop:295 length:219 start_codon:yes stop_codon:yes gene_type:complete